MSELLAARSQMAVSLAFHIVFAMVGIAMPVLMVVAERRWQVTGQDVYLDLARRWAKGTAILFAVGAVSGTVLSFELGLLWPEFMRFAGPIIGMPFSLEGFAFFTEAIFLGVYLYGWERISRRAHLAAGVLVAVSGGLSGIFVVIANAWMNTPTGFELIAGRAVNVDPLAAMANPAALPQAAHMTLAAYAATGLGVAGIHAFLLLHDPSNAFHRRALVIALLVGGPAAVLQPVSGDFVARHVARYQPTKLAAAEALFETKVPAPLVIGGGPGPGVHRDRSGLGRHGSGSPALGDLRGPEDRGRCHADAGADRAVSHVHAAVLLPGRDRGLAAVPSNHSKSAGHRMSLAELVAGIIVVALNAYALLGGADFGGGVWALLASGPRRGRRRHRVAEGLG